MQLNWAEFATIALVHLLAVASPGPDFAIVVRHSVHYGRRIALLTSLGVGTGILLHVCYSILGVSLLIATTAWLFNLIKYLAAIYLLYLAFSALSSKANDTTVTEQNKPSSVVSTAINARKAFVRGFITNGINPKATLFFLSLFTLVISPETQLVTKFFYGAYLALATALWFCLLSFLLNLGPVNAWLQRFSIWIDRAMGVLLIVVAVNIIFFAKV